MIKHTATHTLQTGLKIVALVVLGLFCQLSLAGAESLVIHCPETTPGSQVYDLEECAVTEGRITNTSILDLSADLLAVIGKDLNNDYSSPASDCSIIGGEISCKLGAFDIDMGCSVATDSNNKRSVSCALKTNPDAPAAPEVFFEVGCNQADGICQVRSDGSILSDLIKSQIPAGNKGNNLSEIADSLLSCVSRNTFAGFQNICDKIVSSLQEPEGVAQVLAFIEKIQPVNPDASADTSVATIKQALTNLGQRLNNIRSGGMASNNTQPTNNYYDGQQWFQAGDILASNNNVANDATTIHASSNISDYGRLSMFINGAAIRSDQSADGVESGSKTDSTVLTMGFDYRFTNQLVAGLAFNIGQSATKFTVAGFKKGTLDTDTHTVTLFGTYYTNNWFFDGSVSMGGDDYEQERNYKCLNVGNGCIVVGEGVAEATYHSSQTTLSLGSGYNWTYKSLNITPYAQYMLGAVKVDQYSERSKDSAILSIQIDEQTKDISTLNLGANFQYIINTEKGVVIPLLSVQLVNEFEDETQFVTGRFVGNKSNSGEFSLATNEVDSSYSIIGAGCTLQLKNGQAGFINIQKTAGYENIDQTRFTVGWRWEI